jgi:hypothetical protein
MDLDDESLLAAVRDGSDSAFNTLIDRHQQAVRTFLRGLTANHSDADDIAQETFLAGWTEAKSFRGQGSVRSWLFSIAWRKAKGSQRLFTMLAGVLAIILAAAFALRSGGGALVPTGAMAAGAALASAYLAFRGRLLEILRRFSI